MLKNGIPFDYRERHPELFSEEAKRRMIDELDARSALENDIDGNGVSGVAGSNESEAGRAARCRELPGRSRDAGQQWFRGDSPMTSAYLSDVGAAPSPLVYPQLHASFFSKPQYMYHVCFKRRTSYVKLSLTNDSVGMIVNWPSF